MAGHHHELETWLTPRGWSMQKGGNGHYKLYHKNCPHPLSASSSPSGLALKKIQSVVRRTERQFGIVVKDDFEKKGGRPPVEPFRFEHGKGGETTHICTCSECGATETVRQSAESLFIPPNQVAVRFRQKGWRIKTQRKDDLCPSCCADDQKVVEARAEVQGRSIPFSQLPEIKLPPPKPKQAVDINIEALNAQQLAAKRKIAALLSRVYIPEIGYLPKESDETVAAKVGCAKELVEIVRRDFYGALKKSTPITALKRQIALYRKEVASFERDVIDRVAKLEAEASAILRWLDQIDERCVPERSDEEEIQTNGHMNGRAA